MQWIAVIENIKKILCATGCINVIFSTLTLSLLSAVIVIVDDRRITA